MLFKRLLNDDSSKISIREQLLSTNFEKHKPLNSDEESMITS